MTTVTWVQNVDGYYEVSSADHLIQIMNRGVWWFPPFGISNGSGQDVTVVLSDATNVDVA